MRSRSFPHLRPFVFSFAALAVAALPRVSHADATSATARTSTDPDGYTYRFKDDPLHAGGLDPNDARLRVVTHAARSLLIRPRAQFVAEMLKSVEDI